jgi:uncharacterized RDD family membrane protein YckC
VKARDLELITPEGVPLRFELASVGERLAAFLLDGLISGVVALLLALAGGVVGIAELAGLFGVLGFVVRMFYFPWFEHRWQGRTPGKRWQGLHVIDRHGKPLPAGAVLARNFVREVEFTLPLQVLLSLPLLALDPGQLGPLFALVWLLGLMIVPLADPERRRVGDHIAGTVVVRKPAPELLRDLADASARGEPDTVAATGTPGGATVPPPANGPAFTPAQLAHYGEYELEVLEKLLRRPSTPPNREAFATVRQQIEAKTGWVGEPVDDLVFLRAFYAAQRAHLEQRLVMGRRRRDKHEG